MEIIDQTHEVLKLEDKSKPLWLTKPFQKLLYAVAGTVVGILIAYNTVFDFGYQQAIRDTGAKVDGLTAEVTRLEKENTRLEKASDDARIASDQAWTEKLDAAGRAAYEKGLAAAEADIRDREAKAFGAGKTQATLGSKSQVEAAIDAQRKAEAQSDSVRRERQAEIDQLTTERDELKRQLEAERLAKGSGIIPYGSSPASPLAAVDGAPASPSSACAENKALVTIGVNVPLITCRGGHIINIRRLTDSAYVTINGENDQNIRLGRSANYEAGCKISLHTIAADRLTASIAVDCS